MRLGVFVILTTLGTTKSLDSPHILQCIDHLSLIKYAIANVSYYCMHDLTVDCTESQRNVNGACSIQISVRIERRTSVAGLLASILIMAGYHMLVYVILR